MKNRSMKVFFPVFSNYEVRVILSRDIVATGKRLHTDLNDCVAAFIKCPEKPKVGWLVLAASPSPADIAHESSHVVTALFAFAGVRRDDEAFAYHLDFLVGRIHKFLERGKTCNTAKPDCS